MKPCDIQKKCDILEVWKRCFRRYIRWTCKQNSTVAIKDCDPSNQVTFLSCILNTKLIQYAKVRRSHLMPHSVWWLLWIISSGIFKNQVYCGKPEKNLLAFLMFCNFTALKITLFVIF